MMQQNEGKKNVMLVTMTVLREGTRPVHTYIQIAQWCCLLHCYKGPDILGWTLVIVTATKPMRVVDGDG